MGSRRTGIAIYKGGSTSYALHASRCLIKLDIHTDIICFHTENSGDSAAQDTCILYLNAWFEFQLHFQVQPPAHVHL